MALNFSANQYDGAFKSDRIQHWELPHKYREHPRRFEGFTQILANQRGHLLPGVRRSRACPWGPFVGTWDMPKRLPSIRMACKTARTPSTADQLMRMKTFNDSVLEGKYKFPRFPGEKGYTVKTDPITRRKVPQRLVEPITDEGLREPAYPPDMPNPPRSPANVYKHPPKPHIPKTNSPIEPNRNMVKRTDPETLDTNVNACTQEQTQGSPKPDRPNDVTTNEIDNATRAMSNLAVGHGTGTPQRLVTPANAISPNNNQNAVTFVTPRSGDMSKQRTPTQSRLGTPKKSPDHLQKTALEEPRAVSVTDKNNCERDVTPRSPIKATTAVDLRQECGDELRQSENRCSSTEQAQLPQV